MERQVALIFATTRRIVARLCHVPVQEGLERRPVEFAAFIFEDANGMDAIALEPQQRVVIDGPDRLALPDGVGIGRLG